MGIFRNIPNWVIVLILIIAPPIGSILIVLKVIDKSGDEACRKLFNSANFERMFDSVYTVSNKVSHKADKLKKMKRKKSILKVFFIIQFVFSLFCFVGLVSDIVSDNTDNLEGAFLVNAVTLGILVPLSISFFKLSNLITKIETYQNLILIRDIYDTKKIAEYLGCSRLEVLDFTSYMIREGFLDLDLENDNLVRPKEYIDPAKVFSITCQNCGAKNKYVKDKENRCEYCNSILSLNKL